MLAENCKHLKSKIQNRISTATFPNSKGELTLMTAPKTIILTGSFLPEKFKDSDADFNLGFAIGAAMSYRILQGYTSIVGLKSEF